MNTIRLIQQMSVSIMNTALPKAEDKLFLFAKNQNIRRKNFWNIQDIIINNKYLNLIKFIIIIKLYHSKLNFPFRFVRKSFSTFTKLKIQGVKL